MSFFLKEAITNFKTTGSIKPSSKYLINDCLKHIDIKENQTILEFGAGDGCITEELLRRMPNSSKLISFEVNPKFYEHCKEKFRENSNFLIKKHSAFNFDEILQDEKVLKVDYIVSSLPLTLFKEEDIIKLFTKITSFLEDKGSYVQYQYSMVNYRLLKESFSKVKMGFTLRNTPPAFVYKCVV